MSLNDSSGSPSDDFFLRIARGEIEGLSAVTKFAWNPDMTAGLHNIVPWPGDALTFRSSATTLDVQSDDVDDTSAGTGARSILIEGLDSNFDVQTEVVSMNGITTVTTTNSFIRVYRAFVLTAGSQGTNDGSILIQYTGTSDYAAYIPEALSQTEQSHYTIPAGKTAYIMGVRASIFDSSKSGTKQGVFSLNIRTEGGVQSTQLTESLNSGGGASASQPTVPLRLPEKTDVWVSVDAFSNNTGATVIYQVILEDNL